MLWHGFYTVGGPPSAQSPLNSEWFKNLRETKAVARILRRQRITRHGRLLSTYLQPAGAIWPAASLLVPGVLVVEIIVGFLRVNQQSQVNVKKNCCDQINRSNSVNHWFLDFSHSSTTDGCTNNSPVLIDKVELTTSLNWLTLPGSP